MKKISLWAKTNPKMAIVTIIFFELTKLSIGTLIGYDFLPKLSSAFIEISIILTILIISFVEINFEHKSKKLQKFSFYKLRILSTGIIFLSSYFLSILFGNHLKNESQFTDSQYFVSAANVEKNTDKEFIESLEKGEFSKKNFTISPQKKLLNFKKQHQDSQNEGGKRALYFLLFLLGCGLTIVGLYVSCALACGNYAVFAILTFLITIGVFSGGIYFLIKTFRKTLKPYKEMDKEEKRKEWKIYLRTLLSITGIIGLLILIQSLSNK